MKLTFDPDKSLADQIAECEFMIAYHIIDFKIVGYALTMKELSPVGEKLASEFLDRKFESIKAYRECLKLLQAKQK